MAEIGKAYVQIVPSAKGISGAITEQLGGEAQKAGKMSGLGIVGALKGIIATAAIGKALTDTIMEGGKLQQSIGGIETLFKGSADTVIKQASQAYKTAGLSANDYMESVTGFSASLLQSLGGDTEKAASISNRALTDMADNSNKMGTSMELIQNAYQGFAKQNYTMLDNLKLGYGGTKTEMQRLLADATKLTGVKYDINNLADVYTAIGAIQDSLGITGTTAKEASTTIIGSFNAMKGAFQNVLGSLATGQGLKESLSGLSETLSTFIFGNLLPMVGNILVQLPSALITFFQTSVPLFMQMGGQMLDKLTQGITASAPTFVTQFNKIISTFFSSALPTFLDKGVEVITNFANGIFANAPTAIGNMGKIINNLLDAVLGALPKIWESAYKLIASMGKGIINNWPSISQSILQVLSKLLTTIGNHLPILLQKGFELIGKMAMGIWNNLPAIINAITSILLGLIRTIAQHLPQFIQKGNEVIAKMAVGFVQALPSLVGKIPGIISSVIGAIGRFHSQFAYMGAQLLMGLAQGIAGAVGRVIRSAVNALGGVVSSIKAFFGIHSPSRVFAEIGKFLSLGLAVGIEDNVKPVSKAVDSLAKVASIDLESQFDLGISKNAIYDRMDSRIISSDFSRYDKDKESLSVFQKLSEKIDEFGNHLPEQIADAVSDIRLDINRREFGRLVRSEL